MKLLSFLVLMTLSSIDANAEDWKTTDGKTYNDVKVVRHDDSTVTILYSEGGAKIGLSTLPKDIQTRFSFAPVEAVSTPQPATNAPPLLSPLEQIKVFSGSAPITVDNVLNQRGYNKAANISFARSLRFEIIDPRSPSEHLFCMIRIKNLGRILTRPKIYSVRFFWAVTTPILSINSEVIFLADNARIKRDDSQIFKSFPFPHMDGMNDVPSEEIAVNLTPDEFRALAFAQNLQLRICSGDEKLPVAFQPYCKIFYEACQKLPETGDTVISK